MSFWVVLFRAGGCYCELFACVKFGHWRINELLLISFTEKNNANDHTMVTWPSQVGGAYDDGHVTIVNSAHRAVNVILSHEDDDVNVDRTLNVTQRRPLCEWLF